MIGNFERVGWWKSSDGYYERRDESFFSGNWVWWLRELGRDR
jgi:hypothetical protein